MKITSYLLHPTISLFIKAAASRVEPYCTSLDAQPISSRMVIIQILVLIIYYFLMQR
ncbi:MAG: hypothetical protein JW822_04965 [Spirochaetales bacterium]|nr:hypothetical protein [Spirochaetales bacterium]